MSLLRRCVLAVMVAAPAWALAQVGEPEAAGPRGAAGGEEVEEAVTFNAEGEEEVEKEVTFDAAGDEEVEKEVTFDAAGDVAVEGELEPEADADGFATGEGETEEAVDFAESESGGTTVRPAPIFPSLDPHPVWLTIPLALLGVILFQVRWRRAPAASKKRAWPSRAPRRRGRGRGEHT